MDLSTPRAQRNLLNAAGCAALTLLVVAVTPFHAPLPAAVFSFVAATTALEWLALRLSGTRWSALSTVTGFHLALALYPGAWLIYAVVPAVIVLAVHRGRPFRAADVLCWSVLWTAFTTAWLAAHLLEMVAEDIDQISASTLAGLVVWPVMAALTLLPAHRELLSQPPSELGDPSAVVSASYSGLTPAISWFPPLLGAIIAGLWVERPVLVFGALIPVVVLIANHFLTHTAQTHRAVSQTFASALASATPTGLREIHDAALLAFADLAPPRSRTCGVVLNGAGQRRGRTVEEGRVHDCVVPVDATWPDRLLVAESPVYELGQGTDRAILVRLTERGSEPALLLYIDTSELSYVHHQDLFTVAVHIQNDAAAILARHMSDTSRAGAPEGVLAGVRESALRIAELADSSYVGRDAELLWELGSVERAVAVHLAGPESGSSDDAHIPEPGVVASVATGSWPR